MTTTQITVERSIPAALVTLNRPAVHNAFDELLIEELTDAFTSLSADSGVRAIVIRGAGPSFCAGADLDWMDRMAGYSHDENLADAKAMQRMFAAIANCPKGVVALIHGSAIGGGAGLAAVCDIAIAAESAMFGFSEVRLGLIPAVISPYVVEKVGPGAARALFITGQRFTAVEALRIGLVQQVVPGRDLDSAGASTVRSILTAGPAAIAEAKRLVRDVSGLPTDRAGEITPERIAAIRVSKEGQEGVRAFLEKRKPDFMP